ncbi:Thioredoxin reductase [plant metagenome]|uniref:Thioredoxin reductase n=1 Tax=plant metagenome TaxID=1297885 RepID=A0A484TT80_9ZZZZ
MPGKELFMRYDVILIGGSYAGLSAALQLARARRRILVVDAGRRRNRAVSHSHGFLAQDGMPPAEIAETARMQVLAYPTVDWVQGAVEDVAGQADAFTVTLSDGTTREARRLIVAAGVEDVLPVLPGLAERWGRQVFHCPYCHGYELGGTGIGVLASSDLAMHQALMLPDWGETTLFLNDAFVPDAAQQDQLRARGTRVVGGAVARLEGEGPGVDIVMDNGRVFALSGLFVATSLRPAPLVLRMGLATEESPMGVTLRTDAMKATSTPGIFACGDVARAAGSVAFAVGDGAMAGMATHRSLMFGL